MSENANVFLRASDGTTYPVPQGRVTVGRTAKNQIVVKNKAVSRLHALLDRKGGVVWVTDLSSRNGTFVNGKRIEAGKKQLLTEGDRLRFSRKSIDYSIIGNGAEEYTTAYPASGIPDLTPPSPAPERSTDPFGFGPSTPELANWGEGVSADSTLAKRFRPVQVISRGGMGQIFLAQDILSGRFVAVKVMLAEVRWSRPHVQQFVREAVITARLQHPHIIPVYDLGFFTDNELYYTMRYVDGQPFSKLIFELELTERLRILRNAALAVEYAHSLGLWHRDLKPQNIMVGSIGDTYVIDWGLVSVQPGREYRLSLPKILVLPNSLVIPDNLIESTDEALTTASGLIGTPAYLAPEQIGYFDCQLASKMGAVSDVWAFGIMLFEVLTDKHPLQELRRNPKALMLRVTKEDLPCPLDVTPSVHPELNALCRRMIVRNPGNRMQSLTEFAREIARYLRMQDRTHC
jgi:Protein kinase domain/FHA domain